MEHQAAPIPVTIPPPEGSSGVPLALVARISGLAIEVTAEVLGVIGDALRRAGSEEPSQQAAADPRPGELVEGLGHAAVGAGAAAARGAVAAASAAVHGMEWAAVAFLRQPVVRDRIDRLADATGAWEARGREQLDTGRGTAADAALDLAATIAGRVVDRLDLDAIVDRVDVDRAVDRLDVDRVAARLDVDGLVRRLDLTRITQGVIDQLDLTAIARRVLDELDLTEIARRVIDELELTELIRESTATVSVDTVDAIRVGGMNADRALARLVDRVLMRGTGSATNGEAPPGDPSAP
jgi:hypothetical protein